MRRPLFTVVVEPRFEFDAPESKILRRRRESKSKVGSVKRKWIEDKADQYIAIHIPNTSGDSLEAALQKVLGETRGTIFPSARRVHPFEGSARAAITGIEHGDNMAGCPPLPRPQNLTILHPPEIQKSFKIDSASARSVLQRFKTSQRYSKRKIF